MKSTHNKLPSSLAQSQATSSFNLPNKRAAFKMVPSTFQPPQQTEPSTQFLSQNKSELAQNQRIMKNFNKVQIQSSQNSQQTQHAISNFNNFNPSIQFISSLVTIKDMINFDEGDCIPIDTDDRWVIVSGEVKIVGTNLCSFIAKEGFVFFASMQTKLKVKQVVSMCSTTAFRISHQIFKQNIRNYLYIKNSQKIKFIQYCPFLTWPQSLSEDIALTMEFIQQNGKQTLIYEQNQEADYLYFVKQGIVLLERTGKSGNQIIMDFQKHYETSYLNQEEGLIIVRKGMIFGVDGILIKEVNKNHKDRDIDLLNSGNPEDILSDHSHPYQYPMNLRTTRIYNAKSIGKCQIYRIDKNVLQTYLKAHGKLGSNKQQSHISNKQLDRICLQYTNLLMGSNHISKGVIKKNFQFKINHDETELQAKRKKVQQIKMQQKRLKKVNPNIQSERRYDNRQIEQSPLLMRSPRRNSKQQNSLNKSKDISLPSLNKKYVQSLIYKKLQSKQAKQAQKYIGYKKKIEASILGKDLKEIKQVKQHKYELQTLQPLKKDKNLDNNLQFIKVRSYRSLLSSLS